MASSTSYRLDPELKRRLAERAAADGVTETALVSRLIDEGLKVAEHPGIVYRNGASGRRAALATGPDVWEVISGVRHAAGSGAAKLADAAVQMGLDERQIQLAVNFASAYPDEIDHRIALNEAAAEKVRQITEERERLIAS